ncbi:hypothetical protein ES705_02050 [subsurface metagenome]
MLPQTIYAQIEFVPTMTFVGTVSTVQKKGSKVYVLLLQKINIEQK